MALTRVYGRVVYPHGEGTPEPVNGDGVIEYVHKSPGIIGNAVHGPDNRRVNYTNGVAEDAWLKPGMWNAYVYPEKVANEKRRNYTLHLGIPESGETTIADAVGESVPDGIVTKGEKGASAYEIAVADGFEGTEQEWLDSLKGAGADLTGYATEEWVSETTAPAEHRHPGEQIDIVYNDGGTLVPLDVQYGFSLALDIAYAAHQGIPLVEQRARDYTDQQIADLPDTAPQTLALTGRDLSISDGNTVTLPASDATVPTTGWRNITGQVAAGSLTSGAVYLIRTGSVVTLHVKTAVVTQGTYASWWLAPTGFSWSSWRRDKMILRREGIQFDTTVVILDQPAAGQISAVSVNGALTCTGSFSWITDDPWPTSPLPGTAITL